MPFQLLLVVSRLSSTETIIYEFKFTESLDTKSYCGRDCLPGLVSSHASSKDLILIATNRGLLKQWQFRNETAVSTTIYEGLPSDPNLCCVRDRIFAFAPFSDGICISWPTHKGEVSKILTRFPNFAPIIDFISYPSDDIKRDRRRSYLSLCGQGKESTLRLIREGFELYPMLCMPQSAQGCSKIIGVKHLSSDPLHSILFLVFSFETRILINSELFGHALNFEEVACDSLALSNRRTLLAENCFHNSLIQVSETQVSFVILKRGDRLRAIRQSVWNSPSAINVASWSSAELNQGFCVVDSVMEKKFTILKLTKPTDPTAQLEISSCRSINLTSEVASITQSSVSFSHQADHHLFFFGSHGPSLGALLITDTGEAQLNEVSLDEVTHQSYSQAVVPESLEINEFRGDCVSLWMGCRDGSCLMLLAQASESDESFISFTCKERVSLGLRPVTIARGYKRDPNLTSPENLFLTDESFILSSKDRTSTSGLIPITKENQRSSFLDATMFSTRDHQHAYMFVNDQGDIELLNLETQSKMLDRVISHIGERGSPKRITYISGLNLYGILFSDASACDSVLELWDLEQEQLIGRTEFPMEGFCMCCFSDNPRNFVKEEVETTEESQERYDASLEDLTKRDQDFPYLAIGGRTSEGKGEVYILLVQRRGSDHASLMVVAIISEPEPVLNIIFTKSKELRVTSGRVCHILPRRDFLTRPEKVSSLEGDEDLNVRRTSISFQSEEQQKVRTDSQSQRDQQIVEAKLQKLFSPNMIIHAAQNSTGGIVLADNKSSISHFHDNKLIQQDSEMRLSIRCHLSDYNNNEVSLFTKDGYCYIFQSSTPPNDSRLPLSLTPSHIFRLSEITTKVIENRVLGTENGADECVSYSLSTLAGGLWQCYDCSGWNELSNNPTVLEYQSQLKKWLSPVKMVMSDDHSQCRRAIDLDLWQEYMALNEDRRQIAWEAVKHERKLPRQEVEKFIAQELDKFRATLI